MANVECMKCRYLIRRRKEIPVKRADGTNEVAGWFECGRGKYVLTTISKYDLPGCPFYLERADENGQNSGN